MPEHQLMLRPGSRDLETEPAYESPAWFDLLDEPAPLGTAAYTLTTSVPSMNGTWNGGAMNNVWYQWITTTTASVTTTNLIWDNWSNTTTTGGTYTLASPYTFTYPTINTPIRLRREALTDDEFNHPPDEWAAIRAQRNVEQAVRDEQNAEARTNASRLLRMVLTLDQINDLDALDCFEVRGSSGQLWRISKGTSGNVRAIDEEGVEILRVCAHPRLRDHSEAYGFLPTEDVMAGQALHLLHDDTEFLARANVHHGNRRSPLLVPGLRVA